MSAGSGAGARALKRAMDLGASATGLAVLSPVLAAAALAVRVSMGSPVFFRQVRPGQHARPFHLVKFRTMRAARPGEEMLATDGDRITRVGQFLRSTSIDELPALWNVLVGDMSLVGPRPLLMRYVNRYTPRQARRHEVKPGVTGWAAVNGRNLTDWDTRFELDVWYVDHWSLWLDVRILAKTITQVLRREGVSHAGNATMTEFLGSGKEAP